MRVATSPAIWEIGRAIVLVSLGIMLALLCSTPVDAIRLPRWISESLILGGAVTLCLLDLQPIHWLAVLMTTVLLAGCRAAGKSPWWAALVGWFPV
jgi:hypothetical protein